jgi:NADH-quinone oxidoreductase subunit I
MARDLCAGQCFSSDSAVSTNCSATRMAWRSVACFLCAAACPSNCIYIEAAENTEEVRISSAERYAKVYNIDYNRCIFCGYCVEACPTDAITHGHGFELASLNATTLVMRKEDLLVGIQPAMPLTPGSDRDQAASLR